MSLLPSLLNIAQSAIVYRCFNINVPSLQPSLTSSISGPHYYITEEPSKTKGTLQTYWAATGAKMYRGTSTEHEGWTGQKEVARQPLVFMITLLPQHNADRVLSQYSNNAVLDRFEEFHAGTVDSWRKSTRVLLWVWWGSPALAMPCCCTMSA